MRLNINWFSIRFLTDCRFLATLYLVVFCIQIVVIEGTEISPIKIGLMSIAPLLFFWKTPFISKALFWGFIYWTICFFCSLFHGNMRFSTIGYLGMFIVVYILFYSLVHNGAFTIGFFTKLLKKLIILFGIVLVMQQFSILIGIYTLPIINLNNQHYLSLTKLPSLTLEPSHTARILTVMMLANWRCNALISVKKYLTLRDIFSKNHIGVTILFLWAMLTMGSGTAFIGLALLSLYFVRQKTLIYVVPLLLILFYIGQSLELTQLDRVKSVAKATMTGDVKAIQTEDGSAASRIVPIMNTLTIDLNKRDSWFGKGTLSHEQSKSAWLSTTIKISVVEQYGLIGLITSLLLCFTCMIRRFLSLESLIFLIIFGFSLGNFAYIWGAMFLFSVVRFFQIQHEKGYLELEYNEER